MSNVTQLRVRAEAEAAVLPPLLARAEQLAGTVLLGEHGRRRSGLGDDFWQYRPVREGDMRRMIDWRRSGRSDEQFVREKEWQIAQSVMLWCDQAASMRFSGHKDRQEKADRARLMSLALGILLIRSGERVGLTGGLLPPRRGELQVLRLAEFFSKDAPDDYAAPEARAMLPHARAVFISDFLGDIDAIEAALTKAADRGVRGVLLQVLDPVEEAFPYDGRAIFESMGGSLRHETLKAGELRDRYLQRLAERRARLQEICHVTSWRFGTHHTDHTAQEGLLWLWQALDGGRG
ncbi:DUF58 domain-containing protein [Mesobacterium pallidum]|uniref:DUF58 domain-containing protein n=1 Tax=Mesobacterium pallidum TaxID=2872037 RepID=UPI001EE19D4D